MKPIRPLRPARGGKNNPDRGGEQDKNHRQTIRLPHNHRTLIKAAIIGKGGSQIKLISELSNGCRVKVEESRVVIYPASQKDDSSNVQIAVNLVQSIINNVLCAFEHPNVICSIYEIQEKNCMKLTRYETPSIDEKQEEGKKSNHHQNYYRLDQCNDDETPSSLEEVKDHSDEATSSIVQSLTEKKLVKSDHQLYSQRKERRLISEGLSSAVSNYLKLDQFEGMQRKLLIKVGMGRKVFYDAKRSIEMTSGILDRVYNFESFSKLDIGYGKDIKSSFRLEMGEDFALNLREYLLKNEWKHTETSKSATCYVVKLMEGIMGSAGGKRMSFKIIPTNNSSAKIAKLKTALDKLSYLDFCNLEESHPDLRLRFETEQYSRESTDEEFNKFISALKFNEKDQVDISNIPQELLNTFRIDSIRNKVKEIYCLNDVKITINKIFSKGSGWYEISMSSLQPYNELSSTEDVSKVLSTMRRVLDGVCGSRKHFQIVSEKVTNISKRESTTTLKQAQTTTSYWSVLAVAAFCTAVGFGLNRIIHK